MTLKRVTIREVAERAGVSIATASRVAGGYGYVSEENRRKVLAAVKALGYRPNVLARSMVTRSTGSIGLVITDILNPFFAQLARGVEDEAWKSGYTLMLCNTDEDLQHEVAVVRSLLEKQVDGLIVIPASSKSAAHLQEACANVPLVLADRSVENLPVDTILVDNEEGAHRAITHLLGLGHRRIGMVLDNPDITTNAERLAGYQRAFRQQGLEPAAELIQSCQYTRQSACDVVQRMLQSPAPPTALFTANNFMTLGAMRAIQEAGLKIPHDIALVGFDELEWNQVNEPQLTSVAQPVHEMGAIAANRLLARLKGENMPPMEIRLKTSFIIRRSCGAGQINQG